MFFIVLARDKPGQSDLRRATKARHKRHLDAGAPTVRVLQSGPLLDEAGMERGSLIVVAAGTKDAVHTFVARDPYVEAGLFASFEVQQWGWQRGNIYLPDTSHEAAA